MKSHAGEFRELLGEDLSGVCFVRDYLQLQFNPPPTLNAYTPVTVRCREAVASFGEDAFPNLLLGLLNKVVRDVEFLPDEALRIIFDDASTIAVSLRPADYVGPEAINFICRNKIVVL